MKRRAACLSAALALAVAAEGCSGGPAPLPVTAAPASAFARGTSRSKLAVTFRFRIPRRSHRRGARYLSPSTGSIVVKAYNFNHTVKLAQAETDTVPGFNGCSTVTNGEFTCPVALSLAPNSYAFDVFSYDATGAAGNLLSAYTNFAHDVAAGHANSIAMTLDGVPDHVVYGFAGNSPLVNGNTTPVLSMAGTGSGAAQQFQVETEDADGNVIVGSGAPSIHMLASDTTDLSVAKVTGTSGTFTLTPLHATATPITLSVEAIPGDRVASAIYGSAQLSIDHIVYIANPGNGTVVAYAPWSNAPILTIPKTAVANPYTIALDAKGNLYVVDFQITANLDVFAPGSTTPSRTITGLVAGAFGLAVDASGDIFVTEYLTKDVKEFTPSGGSTPSRTLSSTTSPSGINTPAGLALDSAGNVYVANNAGTIGVSEYAPGTSTTPSAVCNSGMSKPAQLAFDASGNLYVSNNGASSVTEYSPPFTNACTAARTFSSANTTTPFSVAIDPSDNVWVGTSGGNLVEFTSTGSVVRTVTGYSMAVYAIATDPSGDAYVTDNGGNAVDEFSPSSGTTPIAALTSGISQPTDIVVW